MEEWESKFIVNNNNHNDDTSSSSSSSAEVQLPIPPSQQHVDNDNDISSEGPAMKVQKNA